MIFYFDAQSINRESKDDKNVAVKTAWNNLIFIDFDIGAYGVNINLYIVSYAFEVRAVQHVLVC
jgi:hypothetical protein